LRSTLKPVEISTDHGLLVCRNISNDGTSKEFEVKRPVIKTQDLSKYVETINITDGAILNITDAPADLLFNLELKSEPPSICIGCHLSGDMVYIEEGRGEPIYFKEESMFISKMSVPFHATKRTTGRLRSMSVMFYPGAEKLMFGESVSLLKDRYSTLFDTNSHFSMEQHTLSPFVKALAESIANCNLKSHKREFYMKSKAMELLNYIFSEYMIKSGMEVSKSVLQPGEVKKIRNLREYLNTNINTAPSINELSKITGLNDCKLKAGFKEVFGTTIYGYIKAEKMSRAKIMLETGRYSVSEIAWDIGYTNVSHFIKAFKKYYCVTPGQMLIQIKNDISRHEINHA